MKHGWLLLWVLLTGACLVDNPRYVPPDLTSPPDMAPGPPDMAPTELLVPGGTYALAEGAADGGASASFSVPGFYLDVHEITVREYRGCVGKGACTVPGTSEYCNWTPQPGSKEDHPINCIKWRQAVDYCKYAGNRRLPTEAEWEYAAAGTLRGKYPWGSSEPTKGAGQQLCWNKSDGTCPVGSYPKTYLGFADLAGNVWEWTDSQRESPYMHPQPACMSGCSLRGGSWVNTTTDSDYFRAAYRYSNDPSLVSGIFGARCARTP